MGVAILGVSIFVGLSIGLDFPSAVILALPVAAPYAWLAKLCGPKTLALPISGLIVGFFVVLLIQFFSNGATIGWDYYVFGSALSLCIFSFVGPVPFLVIPKLRVRIFSPRTEAVAKSSVKVHKTF